MPVVAFLEGVGSDASGRTVSDILERNDAWLEHEHDFIQWLFPLCEASEQVEGAPILSEDEVVHIRASRAAQDNLRRATARMLAFYRDNDHWLRSMDHNHLRITRMLKSVRLLVSLDEAVRLYDILMERVHEAGDPIASRNLRYWSDAVGLSYGV